jgi:hypothetical protein
MTALAREGTAIRISSAPGPAGCGNGAVAENRSPRCECRAYGIAVDEGRLIRFTERTAPGRPCSRPPAPNTQQPSQASPDHPNLSVTGSLHFGSHQVNPRGHDVPAAILPARARNPRKVPPPGSKSPTSRPARSYTRGWWRSSRDRPDLAPAISILRITWRKAADSRRYMGLG